VGQVLDFPSPTEQEWLVWERVIRASSKGTLFDADVVDAALPAIKAHWQSVFQPVTLECPAQAVPGPLTEQQGVAIQRIADASAQTVVDRLKQERASALSRLVQAELMLSLYRLRGIPS
jgi:hypothetical protein